MPPTSCETQPSVNTGELSTSSNSDASTVSLYSLVLFAQSYALNVDPNHSLQAVVRPIDSKDAARTTEEVEVESTGDPDAHRGGHLDSLYGDDEVLLHVRFSELVKIKSILVGTGGGRSDLAPRSCKVFVNRPDGLSFEEAEEGSPEQEFELLESEGGGRGSQEYPLRPSKFGNVRELTIRMSNTRSTMQSRLFFLGFLGSARALKKEPGEALKIGAEQGVHSMIQGVRETKGSGYASVR